LSRRGELHLKSHPISREYFPYGASWVEQAVNAAKPAERQHNLLRKQFTKRTAFRKSSKRLNCDAPIHCRIHYFPLNVFAHKWKTQMIQEIDILK
jgi:hypothetical protein